jgi:uncharacterized protein YbbC (DUF1343 family)
MIHTILLLQLLLLVIAECSTFVQPGINGDLSILNGHRIGLITNPTGVASNFTATIDLLFAEKKKFQLVALFAPEHGLRGDQPPGQYIPSYIDPITKLPVYSIYGNTYAPTPDQLKNVTLLLFDLQGVGARCYTIISTMAYCLRAAANNSLPFVVVDRVNPTGASQNDIDGPVLDLKFKSFIGIWNIALRHGMTIGELALMFNTEMNINHPKLHVLKIQGDYSKRLPIDSYENTAWLPTSPNLPTLESAFLYPGIVMYEAMRNVSLGRGTATPFQIIGAPFMDPYKLLNYIYNTLLPLNPEMKNYLDGVVLVPAFWIPSTDIHAGEQCAGIRILVLDRSKMRPIALSLTLIRAMLDIYPVKQLQFQASSFNIIMGYDAYTEMLAKVPIENMIKSWQSDLNNFYNRRSKYLLY